MEELYGYPPERFPELTVEEFSADTSGFTQAEAVERIRAAAEGEPQTFDWHGMHANGELLWVRVRLSRTTFGEDRYVVAEVRDITDIKERERRLNLLYRVLRHNLRNEMNVILGYADQLESSLEDETLERHTERIMETAREVAALRDSVTQIQSVAERDAAERSTMAAVTLAEDAIEALQADHPEADVALAETDDLQIDADEGLRVALDHLLENAVEHNDRETPTVRVSVTESESGGRARIAVVDDGPPIPEMEIAALDDLRDITSTAHGSGLGLWVVKWCVESLGGEVSFERNEPRGNRVTLHVPRCERVDNPADDDPA